MAQQDDDTAGDEEMDLNNKDLLRILVQEIADVRREILEDADGKFVKIHTKIDALTSDMKTLRMEVH